MANATERKVFWEKGRGETFKKLAASRVAVEGHRLDTFNH